MALGRAQAMPQPLQLAASARTFTSQPSAALALQSAQPPAHLPTVQLPAAQLTPAWSAMHAVPHMPQFCASLLVSVQALLQHFIEPPQRLSSLQPGTQVEVAPSTLQTLPVGQSVSPTQATQRPSRQTGVAPLHAGSQPRGPES